MVMLVHRLNWFRLSKQTELHIQVESTAYQLNEDIGTSVRLPIQYRPCAALSVWFSRLNLCEDIGCRKNFSLSG